jgi:hypothetical protein
MESRKEPALTRASTILLVLGLFFPSALLPAPGAVRAHPRMVVTVTAVTPAREPIPGVSIALCPEGKGPEGKEGGCVYRITGPYGWVRFDNLEPVRYSVRAELANFLPVTVSSLRLDEVGRGKMRIPDLVLVMNRVTAY